MQIINWCKISVKSLIGVIFMEIKTVAKWDEELWQDANTIYKEAFGEKGAKPVKIIKNMLAKGIAELHVGYSDAKPIVMALTGKLTHEKVMLIDYLAVLEKERNHGIGKQFVTLMSQKAMSEGYEMLIIEAESETTPDNLRRMAFWQTCGFYLTSYIHTYIWVPETYQAMYLPLTNKETKKHGEELFVYVNTFHRMSFSDIKK
ncbi:GNAT family N-acetyltransferase [Niallia circulans]|uniref:GNAT family N-acetyltransferase n=2 Tax=Niallia circulans TaxID=1397 RepID=A0A553SSP3_NIACI|nr:GNAT family N-acetyltransferase [Niallia circulans]